MKENFQNYAVHHLGIPSTTVEAVAKHQVKASVGTPMILEEREMRATQMSVFDRLMMDRIIWVSGAVESNMSAILQAQLMYLDSIEEKDISLHLDTPGGSVLSGLGIRDIMNYVKSAKYKFNLNSKSENYREFEGRTKENAPDLRVPSSWQKFNVEVGLHPTQKPVPLFEYIIKTYTNEGELVLDCCAGSGTTGVACKNLNRDYVLIEKEEKYYNGILERLDITDDFWE